MSEIKEDFLESDNKIPGQNYVCLSFVSPEKILKQKELFFATKFLDYVINDNEQSSQDFRDKMLNKQVLSYDVICFAAASAAAAAGR